MIMEPTFGTLTLMFPMWNEEEMIQRTVGAARETGGQHMQPVQVAQQCADYRHR